MYLMFVQELEQIEHNVAIKERGHARDQIPLARAHRCIRHLVGTVNGVVRFLIESFCRRLTRYSALDRGNWPR